MARMRLKRSHVALTQSHGRTQKELWSLEIMLAWEPNDNIGSNLGFPCLVGSIT